MNNPSSPRVTQEDRDAAANLSDAWLGIAGDSNEVRQGLLDDWHVVQAFARHRLAHTTDGHSTAGEPVAWLYECGEPFPVRYIHDVRMPAYLADEDGWTETPLYAATPPHTSDTAGEGWRDIASAPKDGTRILVRFGEALGIRVDAARWIANQRGSGGYFSSHIVEHVQGERYMRKNQPGHWMPMPSATLSQHTSDSALREAWQPIETAPRDGTEFIAWSRNIDRPLHAGGWNERCRFNPDSGAFEIWGRIDYDEDGWDCLSYVEPTHWMPEIPAPATLSTEAK